MKEVRLDRLRDEWVIISSERAARPLTLAGQTGCPFCPGNPETSGKEAPYWLPNAYPMLAPEAEGPAGEDRMPGKGYCEVIVESFDHRADLNELNAEQLYRAFQLYAQRYEELSSRPSVKAVAVFRNLGRLIGVTIEHPHSQVYAVPFVPPVLQEEERSFAEHCPLCSRSGKPIFESDSVIVEMPFAPRWPYEARVYPKRHAPSLVALEEQEMRELATGVGRLIGCYHRLFGVKMPYVMALHQAPLANAPSSIHVHVDLYPALRAPDKLKHWSGAEVGFGIYTYDFDPDAKLEELKQVCKGLPSLPIPSEGLPEPSAI
ncbi:MAG: hypothetical protein RAK24_04720 [TACK group archaeon]|nr:hypothetical protein [TACK group archaeon]